MDGESTVTAPATSTRPDRLTLLAFAAMVLLLGMNFVAVRFSNRELAPFWGSGIRFALAAFILLAIVAVRRFPLPRGRALTGAALYGLLAFGASYALLYWAMLRVGAGTTSVLFATVPLLTFFMATGLGMEEFRWRGLVGALLAVGGIGLVYAVQLDLGVPLASVAAVLASAATAAASGIILKRLPRAHPVSVNAAGMTAGAALLLLLSLLAREPMTMPALAATQIAFAWLVTTSMIGFVLFAWIIRRWTASATSYMTVLMPLVAIAGGALLAGEAVTWIFIAGAALVLAGVYVGALSGGARAGSRRPTAPPVKTPPAR